ncbi:MAG: CidA/LrgA family protein [Spirochaetaceae bacterium]|jgi:holin-like protein|nr:CidA/LrgA family protein [Spirochaetaceae bacterium]
MNIALQCGLIFGLCLVGEVVSPLLPITFPGNLIAMILLFMLLAARIVKAGSIREITAFLQKHMTLFFMPPCIAIVQELPLLKRVILPFLVIGIISTVLTFWAAAAAASLASKLQDAYTGGKDKGHPGHG